MGFSRRGPLTASVLAAVVTVCAVVGPLACAAAGDSAPRSGPREAKPDDTVGLSAILSSFEEFPHHKSGNNGGVNPSHADGTREELPTNADAPQVPRVQGGPEAERSMNYGGNGGGPQYPQEGSALPRQTTEEPPASEAALPWAAAPLVRWETGATYTYRLRQKYFPATGANPEVSQLREWDPPLSTDNHGVQCQLRMSPLRRERCARCTEGFLGVEPDAFGVVWEGKESTGGRSRRHVQEVGLGEDGWLVRATLRDCRPLHSRYSGPYTVMPPRTGADPRAGSPSAIMDQPYYASVSEDGVLRRFYFHSNETADTITMKKGTAAALGFAAPPVAALAAQRHPGHRRMGIAAPLAGSLGPDVAGKPFPGDDFFRMSSEHATPLKSAVSWYGDAVQNNHRRNEATYVDASQPVPEVVSWKAVDVDENGVHQASYMMRRADSRTIQVRRDVDVQRTMLVGASAVDADRRRRLHSSAREVEEATKPAVFQTYVYNVDDIVGGLVRSVLVRGVHGIAHDDPTKVPHGYERRETPQFDDARVPLYFVETNIELVSQSFDEALLMEDSGADLGVEDDLHESDEALANLGKRRLMVGEDSSKSNHILFAVPLAVTHGEIRHATMSLLPGDVDPETLRRVRRGTSTSSATDMQNLHELNGIETGAPLGEFGDSPFGDSFGTGTHGGGGDPEANSDDPEDLVMAYLDCIEHGEADDADPSGLRNTMSAAAGCVAGLMSLVVQDPACEDVVLEMLDPDRMSELYEEMPRVPPAILSVAARVGTWELQKALAELLLSFDEQYPELLHLRDAHPFYNTVMSLSQVADPERFLFDAVFESLEVHAEFGDQYRQLLLTLGAMAAQRDSEHPEHHRAVRYLEVILARAVVENQADERRHDIFEEAALREWVAMGPEERFTWFGKVHGYDKLEAGEVWRSADDRLRATYNNATVAAITAILVRDADNNGGYSAYDDLPEQHRFLAESLRVQHVQLRTAMLAATNSRSQRFAAPVRRLAEHGHVGIRATATTALGHFPGPESRSLLCKVFSDRDVDARQRVSALESLEQWPDDHLFADDEVISTMLSYLADNIDVDWKDCGAQCAATCQFRAPDKCARDCAAKCDQEASVEMAIAALYRNRWGGADAALSGNSIVPASPEGEPEHWRVRGGRRLFQLIEVMEMLLQYTKFEFQVGMNSGFQTAMGIPKIANAYFGVGLTNMLQLRLGLFGGFLDIVIDNWGRAGINLFGFSLDFISLRLAFVTGFSYSVPMDTGIMGAITETLDNVAGVLRAAPARIIGFVLNVKEKVDEVSDVIDGYVQKVTDFLDTALTVANIIQDARPFLKEQLSKYLEIAREYIVLWEPLEKFKGFMRNLIDDVYPIIKNEPGGVLYEVTSVMDKVLSYMTYVQQAKDIIDQLVLYFSGEALEWITDKLMEYAQYVYKPIEYIEEVVERFEEVRNQITDTVHNYLDMARKFTNIEFWAEQFNTHVTARFSPMLAPYTAIAKDVLRVTKLLQAFFGEGQFDMETLRWLLVSVMGLPIPDVKQIIEDKIQEALGWLKRNTVDRLDNLLQQIVPDTNIASIFNMITTKLEEVTSFVQGVEDAFTEVASLLGGANNGGVGPIAAEIRSTTDSQSSRWNTAVARAERRILIASFADTLDGELSLVGSAHDVVAESITNTLDLLSGGLLQSSYEALLWEIYAGVDKQNAQAADFLQREWGDVASMVGDSIASLTGGVHFLDPVSGSSNSVAAAELALLNNVPQLVSIAVVGRVDSAVLYGARDAAIKSPFDLGDTDGAAAAAAVEIAGALGALANFDAPDVSSGAVADLLDVLADDNSVSTLNAGIQMIGDELTSDFFGSEVALMRVRFNGCLSSMEADDVLESDEESAEFFERVRQFSVALQAMHEMLVEVARSIDPWASQMADPVLMNEMIDALESACGLADLIDSRHRMLDLYCPGGVAAIEALEMTTGRFRVLCAWMKLIVRVSQSLSFVVSEFPDGIVPRLEEPLAGEASAAVDSAAEVELSPSLIAAVSTLAGDTAAIAIGETSAIAEDLYSSFASNLAGVERVLASVINSLENNGAVHADAEMTLRLVSFSEDLQALVDVASHSGVENTLGLHIGVAAADLQRIVSNGWPSLDSLADAIELELMSPSASLAMRLFMSVCGPVNYMAGFEFGFDEDLLSLLDFSEEWADLVLSRADEFLVYSTSRHTPGWYSRDLDSILSTADLLSAAARETLGEIESRSDAEAAAEPVADATIAALQQVEQLAGDVTQWAVISRASGDGPVVDVDELSVDDLRNLEAGMRQLSAAIREAASAGEVEQSFDNSTGTPQIVRPEVCTEVAVERVGVQQQCTTTDVVGSDGSVTPQEVCRMAQVVFSANEEVCQQYRSVQQTFVDVGGSTAGWVAFGKLRDESAAFADALQMSAALRPVVRLFTGVFVLRHQNLLARGSQAAENVDDDDPSGAIEAVGGQTVEALAAQRNAMLALYRRGVTLRGEGFVASAAHVLLLARDAVFAASEELEEDGPADASDLVESLTTAAVLMGSFDYSTATEEERVEMLQALSNVLVYNGRVDGDPAARSESGFAREERHWAASAIRALHVGPTVVNLLAAVDTMTESAAAVAPLLSMWHIFEALTPEDPGDSPMGPSASLTEKREFVMGDVYPAVLQSLDSEMVGDATAALLTLKADIERIALLGDSVDALAAVSHLGPREIAESADIGDVHASYYDLAEIFATIIDDNLGDDDLAAVRDILAELLLDVPVDDEGASAKVFGNVSVTESLPSLVRSLSGTRAVAAAAHAWRAAHSTEIAAAAIAEARDAATTPAGDDVVAFVVGLCHTARGLSSLRIFTATEAPAVAFASGDVWTRLTEKLADSPIQPDSDCELENAVAILARAVEQAGAANDVAREVYARTSAPTRVTQLGLLDPVTEEASSAWHKQRFPLYALWDLHVAAESLARQIFLFPASMRSAATEVVIEIERATSGSDYFPKIETGQSLEGTPLGKAVAEFTEISLAMLEAYAPSGVFGSSFVAFDVRSHLVPVVTHLVVVADYLRFTTMLGDTRRLAYVADLWSLALQQDAALDASVDPEAEIYEVESGAFLPVAIAADELLGSPAAWLMVIAAESAGQSLLQVRDSATSLSDAIAAGVAAGLVASPLPAALGDIDSAARAIATALESAPPASLLSYDEPWDDADAAEATVTAVNDLLEAREFLLESVARGFSIAPPDPISEAIESTAALVSLLPGGSSVVRAIRANAKVVHASANLQHVAVTAFNYLQEPPSSDPVQVAVGFATITSAAVQSAREERFSASQLLELWGWATVAANDFLAVSETLGGVGRLPELSAALADLLGPPAEALISMVELGPATLEALEDAVAGVLQELSFVGDPIRNHRRLSNIAWRTFDYHEAQARLLQHTLSLSRLVRYSRLTGTLSDASIATTSVVGSVELYRDEVGRPDIYFDDEVVDMWIEFATSTLHNAATAAEGRVFDGMSRAAFPSGCSGVSAVSDNARVLAASAISAIDAMKEDTTATAGDFDKLNAVHETALAVADAMDPAVDVMCSGVAETYEDLSEVDGWKDAAAMLSSLWTMWERLDTHLKARVPEVPELLDVAAGILLFDGPVRLAFDVVATLRVDLDFIGVLQDLEDEAPVDIGTAASQFCPNLIRSASLTAAQLPVILDRYQTSYDDVLGVSVADVEAAAVLNAANAALGGPVGIPVPSVSAWTVVEKVRDLTAAVDGVFFDASPLNELRIRALQLALARTCAESEEMRAVVQQYEAVQDAAIAVAEAAAASDYAAAVDRVADSLTPAVDAATSQMAQGMVDAINRRGSSALFLALDLVDDVAADLAASSLASCRGLNTAGLNGCLAPNAAVIGAAATLRHAADRIGDIDARPLLDGVPLVGINTRVPALDESDFRELAAFLSIANAALTTLRQSAEFSPSMSALQAALIKLGASDMVGALQPIVFALKEVLVGPSFLTTLTELIAVLEDFAGLGWEIINPNNIKATLDSLVSVLAHPERGGPNFMLMIGILRYGMGLAYDALDEFGQDAAMDLDNIVNRFRSPDALRYLDDDSVADFDAMCVQLSEEMVAQESFPALGTVAMGFHAALSMRALAAPMRQLATILQELSDMKALELAGDIWDIGAALLGGDISAAVDLLLAMFGDQAAAVLGALEDSDTVRDEVQSAFMHAVDAFDVDPELFMPWDALRVNKVIYLLTELHDAVPHLADPTAFSVEDDRTDAALSWLFRLKDVIGAIDALQADETTAAAVPNSIDVAVERVMYLVNVRCLFTCEFDNDLAQVARSANVVTDLIDLFTDVLGGDLGSLFDRGVDILDEALEVAFPLLVDQNADIPWDPAPYDDSVIELLRGVSYFFSDAADNSEGPAEKVALESVHGNLTKVHDALKDWTTDNGLSAQRRLAADATTVRVAMKRVIDVTLAESVVENELWEVAERLMAYISHWVDSQVASNSVFVTRFIFSGLNFILRQKQTMDGLSFSDLTSFTTQAAKVEEDLIDTVFQELQDRTFAELSQVDGPEVMTAAAELTTAATGFFEDVAATTDKHPEVLAKGISEQYVRDKRTEMVQAVGRLLSHFSSRRNRVSMPMVSGDLYNLDSAKKFNEALEVLSATKLAVLRYRRIFDGVEYIVPGRCSFQYVEFTHTYFRFYFGYVTRIFRFRVVSCSRSVTREEYLLTIDALLNVLSTVTDERGDKVPRDMAAFSLKLVQVMELVGEIGNLVNNGASKDAIVGIGKKAMALLGEEVSRTLIGIVQPIAVNMAAFFDTSVTEAPDGTGEGPLGGLMSAMWSVRKFAVDTVAKARDVIDWLGHAIVQVKQFVAAVNDFVLDKLAWVDEIIAFINSVFDRVLFFLTVLTDFDAAVGLLQQGVDYLMELIFGYINQGLDMALDVFDKVEGFINDLEFQILGATGTFQDSVYEFLEEAEKVAKRIVGPVVDKLASVMYSILSFVNGAVTGIKKFRQVAWIAASIGKMFAEVPGIGVILGGISRVLFVVIDAIDTVLFYVNQFLEVANIIANILPRLLNFRELFAELLEMFPLEDYVRSAFQFVRDGINFLRNGARRVRDFLYTSIRRLFDLAVIEVSKIIKKGQELISGPINWLIEQISKLQESFNSIIRLIDRRDWLLEKIQWIMDIVDKVEDGFNTAVSFVENVIGGVEAFSAQASSFLDDVVDGVDEIEDSLDDGITDDDGFGPNGQRLLLDGASASSWRGRFLDGTPITQELLMAGYHHTTAMHSGGPIVRVEDHLVAKHHGRRLSAATFMQSIMEAFQFVQGIFSGAADIQSLVGDILNMAGLGAATACLDGQVCIWEVLGIKMDGILNVLGFIVSGIEQVIYVAENLDDVILQYAGVLQALNPFPDFLFRVEFFADNLLSGRLFGIEEGSGFSPRELVAKARDFVSIVPRTARVVADWILSLQKYLDPVAALLVQVSAAIGWVLEIGNTIQFYLDKVTEIFGDVDTLKDTIDKYLELIDITKWIDKGLGLVEQYAYMFIDLVVVRVPFQVNKPILLAQQFVSMFVEAKRVVIGTVHNILDWVINLVTLLGYGKVEAELPPWQSQPHCSNEDEVSGVCIRKISGRSSWLYRNLIFPAVTLRFWYETIPSFVSEGRLQRTLIPGLFESYVPRGIQDLQDYGETFLLTYEPVGQLIERPSIIVRMERRNGGSIMRIYQIYARVEAVEDDLIDELVVPWHGTVRDLVLTQHAESNWFARALNIPAYIWTGDDTFCGSNCPENVNGRNNVIVAIPLEEFDLGDTSTRTPKTVIVAQSYRVDVKPGAMYFDGDLFDHTSKVGLDMLWVAEYSTPMEVAEGNLPVIDTEGGGGFGVGGATTQEDVSLPVVSDARRLARKQAYEQKCAEWRLVHQQETIEHVQYNVDRGESDEYCLEPDNWPRCRCGRYDPTRANSDPVRRDALFCPNDNWPRDRWQPFPQDPVVCNGPTATDQQTRERMSIEPMARPEGDPATELQPRYADFGHLNPVTNEVGWAAGFPLTSQGLLDVDSTNRVNEWDGLGLTVMPREVVFVGEGVRGFAMMKQLGRLYSVVNRCAIGSDYKCRTEYHRMDFLEFFTISHPAGRIHARALNTGVSAPDPGRTGCPGGGCTTRPPRRPAQEPARDAPEAEKRAFREEQDAALRSGDQRGKRGVRTRSGKQRPRKTGSSGSSVPGPADPQDKGSQGTMTLGLATPPGLEALSYTFDAFNNHLLFAFSSGAHPVFSEYVGASKDLEDNVHMMSMPGVDNVPPQITANELFVKLLGFYVVEPTCIINIGDECGSKAARGKQSSKPGSRAPTSQPGRSPPSPNPRPASRRLTTDDGVGEHSTPRGTVGAEVSSRAYSVEMADEAGRQLRGSGAVLDGGTFGPARRSADSAHSRHHGYGQYSGRRAVLLSDRGEHPDEVPAEYVRDGEIPPSRAMRGMIKQSADGSPVVLDRHLASIGGENLMAKYNDLSRCLTGTGYILPPREEILVEFSISALQAIGIPIGIEVSLGIGWYVEFMAMVCFDSRVISGSINPAAGLALKVFGGLIIPAFLKFGLEITAIIIELKLIPQAILGLTGAGALRACLVLDLELMPLQISMGLRIGIFFCIEWCWVRINFGFFKLRV